MPKQWYLRTRRCKRKLHLQLFKRLLWRILSRWLDFSCNVKNKSTKCLYHILFVIEINECNITTGLNQYTSPCLNNGTCFDLVDGYFCQ